MKKERRSKFSLNDSVRATVLVLDREHVLSGVVVKPKHRDSPCYLVKFTDGTTRRVVEEQMEPA